MSGEQTPAPLNSELYNRTLFRKENERLAAKASQSARLYNFLCQPGSPQANNVADLIVNVYECFEGEGELDDYVPVAIAEMLETDSKKSRFVDFFRSISEIKVGRQTESLWDIDCAWPVFLELMRRFERTEAIDDACAKINVEVLAANEGCPKHWIRPLFEALSSSPSFDELAREWDVWRLLDKTTK